MYTYELYIVENGFGFKILCNGSLIITQDYKPNVNGYIVMTEEEAINEAKDVLNRLGGN